MELTEILSMAGQILDEERAVPTVHYEVDPTGAPTGIIAGPHEPVAQAFARKADILERVGTALYNVEEDPRQFVFRSTNYNLLSALQSRVSSDVRPAFIEGIPQRMAQGERSAPWTGLSSRYCSWEGFLSELPLVAEFCVRNLGTEMFMSLLPKVRTWPGVIILLRHIEVMIALNFTVFSNAEYDKLSQAVDVFSQGYNSAAYRSGDRAIAGRSVANRTFFGALQFSAHGIQEKCRKAKYFYLKHSLMEGLNIEINQDRDAVRAHLRELGFSTPLAKSLDEVERLYLDGANAFNLKASMTHLRSFLENLHKETFPLVYTKHGGKLPSIWGEGVNYLRDNGVLSTKEQQFVISLYAAISDEAVHPLIADRQYARLFRNVVIEYALLFLWKLEKLGLKP